MSLAAKADFRAVWRRWSARLPWVKKDVERVCSLSVPLARATGEDEPVSFLKWKSYRDTLEMGENGYAPGPYEFPQ